MQELLKNLIRADSTAENGESSVCRILSEHLERYGIHCRIDAWNSNRANLIAKVKSGNKKPALLFACHLDVVPPGQAQWRYGPFEAIEKNGKIYGRGTADMKGPIVAVVTAIEQIVDSGTTLKGDILFAGCAGEETDSCGARRFMQKAINALPKPAGVIIPEPTDFDIVTAHRGMLWLEVTTAGKTAHGSTPQLGVNAIDSMRTFLAELQQVTIKAEMDSLLGKSSLSVNTITGGEAINVVPDSCSVGIDIRSLPEQKHQEIIDCFEKIFAKLKHQNSDFDAKIGVIRQVDALETKTDCPFVRDFCDTIGLTQTKTVNYTTDGPYFAALEVPIVVFGPGKADICHKPDEYIDIADLEKAVEYYKKIILKFLT
jgi:succinyl-diaminopimelate desuccinylase